MSRRERRAEARSRAKAGVAIPERGVFDKFLGLAGDFDTDVASGKVSALRQFLLLHGAVRSWLWLALAVEHDAGLSPFLLAVAAAVISAGFGLSLAPRLAYLGPRLALAGLALQLALTFPLTDNHFFVELLAVLLVTLVGRHPKCDETLVLRGLMWMTALILFHTGLQKVLYGHYVHGDFLAFMVGRGGRFADLFAFAIPADEIARLQSYNPILTDAGPYRVSEPVVTILSNAIYVLEMGLAVLLMWGRTRAVAACTSILLVSVIQLGAREVVFAMLFVNLLLPFLPGPWNRRLLPFFAVAYLWALGAAWGLFPGSELITPTML